MYRPWSTIIKKHLKTITNPWLKTSNKAFQRQSADHHNPHPASSLARLVHLTLAPPKVMLQALLEQASSGVTAGMTSAVGSPAGSQVVEDLIPWGKPVEAMFIHVYPCFHYRNQPCLSMFPARIVVCMRFRTGLNRRNRVAFYTILRMMAVLFRSFFFVLMQWRVGWATNQGA